MCLVRASLARVGLYPLHALENVWERGHGGLDGHVCRSLEIKKKKKETEKENTGASIQDLTRSP